MVRAYKLSTESHLDGTSLVRFRSIVTSTRGTFNLNNNARASSTKDVGSR